MTQAFRAGVASVAENIIFRGFPAKVSALRIAMTQVIEYYLDNVRGYLGVFRYQLTLYSELSTIIDGANAPDSPYNISQAPVSTDPRVYPSPGTSEVNGPSSKRKRVEDGIVPLGNDIANARYPELVHANKHILKLQETIKAECAQLSDACVGQLSCLFLSYTEMDTGQGQAMG
jgi:proteasome activator subunit 3 (PA28 gamma)